LSTRWLRSAVPHFSSASSVSWLLSRPDDGPSAGGDRTRHPVCDPAGR
jgi:hypothetical protein